MTKVQPTLVPASGSLDILFGNEGTGKKSEVVVWWGLALVERLRRDANALETKLAAARYYNMNCRPAALVEHFGFARTTLRRYGAALKSGDPKQVARAFGGQGGPRTKSILSPSFCPQSPTQGRGAVRRDPINLSLRPAAERCHRSWIRGTSPRSRRTCQGAPVLASG